MVDPSGIPAAEAEIPPVDGYAAFGGAHRSCEELITELDGRLSQSDSDWRKAVLEIVGQWPVPEEEVNGRRYVYLLGGEAFDWRLLAERLILDVRLAPPLDAWQQWINSPDLFAGHEEAEFMRLLGVDKYRGILSFFYGVTVEQALLAAVEEEITKRRVASGREPSEKSREEAYARLYSKQLDSLWSEFSEEFDLQPARPGRRHRDERTMADTDAFTYWLFKRRMSQCDPARVASDTRKGLAQLERMRRAHERRLKFLASG